MQEKHDLSITAALPHIGIDEEKIPKVDLSKIKDNSEAYIMLLNTLKTSSDAYEAARTKIAELERENRKLEKRSEARKSSVIILTVAEVITSIGCSGLYADNPIPAIFVIVAGFLMTVLSLWLNFKS